MDDALISDVFVLSNYMKRDLNRLYQGSPSSNGEGRVLLFLETRFSYGFPAQAKDIEREFNLQKSTVSELLKSLEEKGYIEKEADEKSQNGRGLNIFITEEGKKLNAMTRAFEESISTRYASYLSEEEKGALHSLLGKLIKERTKEEK